MQTTFSTTLNTLDTLSGRSGVSIVDHENDLRAELAGSVLSKRQRAVAQATITEAELNRQVWLRRVQQKAAARESRLAAMREAAGPKPTAAIDAAIKQIQNRLEHSR
jgi:hypothetical protein